MRLRRQHPTAPFPRIRTQAAFSLVELIVVVAIIVVLIGILLPVAGVVRARSRQTQCANNLRTIGAGIFLHEQTYHRLPPATREDAATWELMHAMGTDLPPWEDAVLATRACVPQNLSCPALLQDGQNPANLALGLSYAMNRNYAGAAISRAPGHIILAAEVNPHLGLQYVGPDALGRGLLAERHSGRANWLFFDGHVEPLPVDWSAQANGAAWGDDQRQLRPAARPER